MFLIIIWWFVCQPNFYLGWSKHSTLVTMKTGSGRRWNRYKLRPMACHSWFDKNRAPWGPTNCLIRLQPVQCCDPTIAISIKSVNYCANCTEEMRDCRTVAHRIESHSYGLTPAHTSFIIANLRLSSVNQISKLMDVHQIMWGMTVHTHTHTFCVFQNTNIPCVCVCTCACLCLYVYLWMHAHMSVCVCVCVCYFPPVFWIDHFWILTQQEQSRSFYQCITSIVSVKFVWELFSQEKYSRKSLLSYSFVRF